MIVSLLAGGLGNQMFRYAMGYAVAARHETALRLDLSFFGHFVPPETPRSYQLDRFTLSGRPLNRWEQMALNLAGPSVSHHLGWRVLRKLPVPRLRPIADAKRGFDPAAAAAPNFSYLNGDWQSEKYFAHVREPLLREFEFKSPASGDNAAMLRQIAAGPSVCVHVRRGDYTLSHQLTQAIGTDYYGRALAWMGARVPEAGYFVFSDDPQWVRSHISWPAKTTFVTHNLGRDDTQDLRLMSQCSHFIIANSTFSWWAAWLGRSTDKLVTAPRQWYAKPHPSEADLVPERWNRM